MPNHRMLNKIGISKGTGGTETSKYPEEEKLNKDSVSSGERMRKSPNLLGFCVSIYGRANKLVDEYLKGVETLQRPGRSTRLA